MAMSPINKKPKFWTLEVFLAKNLDFFEAISSPDVNGNIYCAAKNDPTPKMPLGNYPEGGYFTLTLVGLLAAWACSE